MEQELTPDQKRYNFISELRRTYAGDLEKFNETESKLVAHITGVMNNLATISGAFAVGAMVLLGAPIPVYESSVVFGIVVLIAQVFFIFLYQLHYHGKDTKFFLKNKREGLMPTANLILLSEDYLDGKIPWESFDAELQKTAFAERERVRGNNTDFINKPPKTNYWDSFFIIWFGLGAILIIYGLLYPYLSVILCSV